MNVNCWKTFDESYDENHLGFLRTEWRYEVRALIGNKKSELRSLNYFMQKRNHVDFSKKNDVYVLIKNKKYIKNTIMPDSRNTFNISITSTF